MNNDVNYFDVFKNIILELLDIFNEYIIIFYTHNTFFSNYSYGK